MPRRSVLCGICAAQDSKYSCPDCLIPYCSVKCFKEHQAGSSANSEPTGAAPAVDGNQVTEINPEPPEDEEIPDAPILKPLTSLRWPYIPEQPSYADPLKRDEPQPLQMQHYQAIASSPGIRIALSSNPSLPPLLRKLDKLRGTEREEALEALLGVTTDRGTSHAQRAIPHTAEAEEAKAFKQFAEAVEEAVRGEKADAIGLDWVEHR